MWKTGGVKDNRRTQPGCIACAMPISPGFISLRVASFRCSGRQQGEHGKARICVCGAKAGSAWIWQPMGSRLGNSRKYTWRWRQTNKPFVGTAYIAVIFEDEFGRKND
ncbi:hypothetical protein CN884_20860 [Ochrobactrum sp. 30A/1000/2015]|nr:hypothetical protein CN884_20860 [Ochrobactrum sp. 30A/1000/2015]PJT39545.1 hypothetical protein CN883_06815 [Ochrobactrum sp. 27A/999/2015]PJT43839.1 hypothetical protein CN882_07990 [Ochrobactrum sp. 23A/997/2015]